MWGIGCLGRWGSKEWEALFAMESGLVRTRTGDALRLGMSDGI